VTPVWLMWLLLGALLGVPTVLIFGILYKLAARGPEERDGA
jgi:hypothetical protein